MAAPARTMEELIADAVAARLAPEIQRVRAEVRDALAALRDEQLLTPAEAARVRGVGLRTMQRWIATGQVPSVGEGRARRVRRSALGVDGGPDPI